jgi:hypothetical protein
VPWARYRWGVNPDVDRHVKVEDIGDLDGDAVGTRRLKEVADSGRRAVGDLFRVVDRRGLGDVLDAAA